MFWAAMVGKKLEFLKQQNTTFVVENTIGNKVELKIRLNKTENMVENKKSGNKI